MAKIPDWLIDARRRFAETGRSVVDVAPPVERVKKVRRKKPKGGKR